MTVSRMNLNKAKLVKYLDFFCNPYDTLSSNFKCPDKCQDQLQALRGYETHQKAFIHPNDFPFKDKHQPKH